MPSTLPSLKEPTALPLRISFTQMGQRWDNSIFVLEVHAFKLIDFLHNTQFVTDPLLEFSLLT